MPGRYLEVTANKRAHTSLKFNIEILVTFLQQKMKFISNTMVFKNSLCDYYFE